MIDRFRLALATLAMLLIAASAPVSITGQVLAYQDGFVFFTSGDGFRMASNPAILDDATKKPSTLVPAPRIYARAVFNDAGDVTELDLSRAPLPLEPFPDVVRLFVVTASPPYANPELGEALAQTRNGVAQTFSGRPVLVNITVQVPPNTPLSAQLYLTTDTSGWNPQAIPMDRIDALHYRVTRRIASGTIMRYLYTRGSLQTEERAENGLDRQPREAVINDADVRAVNDVVYGWADLSGGAPQVSQPNAIPTPFNPAPFPNLPSSVPTPHPR